MSIPTSPSFLPFAPPLLLSSCFQGDFLVVSTSSDVELAVSTKTGEVQKISNNSEEEVVNKVSYTRYSLRHTDAANHFT